ncbi:MAG: FGGY family carbohydrate kinase [Clostridia bacterium]|nr:FGGY family carbohydrate kinase [Clostridia bacterium]
MNIYGLDIGTTACKLTVYNENGGLLASAYRDYPVSRSASAHEINPNDIWNSVKAVTEELKRPVIIMHTQLHEKM